MAVAEAPAPAWVLGAAMIVFVGLQVVRTPSLAWRKRRQLDYDPAVQYLRGQFKPSTFIMGGGGLLFALGPQWKSWTMCGWVMTAGSGPR